jgi:hypothetical protein
LTSFSSSLILEYLPMRVTYAVFLDMQLKEALPGFFDQPPGESRSSIDPTNFRIRKELTRIEV